MFPVVLIRKFFSLARCSKHTNMIGTERFCATLAGAAAVTSEKTPFPKRRRKKKYQNNKILVYIIKKQEKA
jgi:hypothetical protein